MRTLPIFEQANLFGHDSWPMTIDEKAGNPVEESVMLSPGVAGLGPAFEALLKKWQVFLRDRVGRCHLLTVAVGR